MVDFKDLWQKRFSNYLKEIGKYSRLIINDHFSIILLIIGAFGALYYRELLLQLQAMDLSILRWVIILGVVAWLCLVFQFGRPIWLTSDPDKSYLFARGEEWHNYWLKSTLVSAIFPIVIISIATVLVMPFLQVISVWDLSLARLLVVYLALFKVISFMLLYLDIFNLGLGQIAGRPLSRGIHSLFVGIVLLFTFSVPSTANIAVPAVIISILTIYIIWAMTKRADRWVAFDYVVEEETLREASFYKWISIFADVPHLKPSVKRRAYLDGLVESMKTLNNDRYSFLFLRSLLRNNAYSGVWSRVMIFVSVLIVLTDNIWMLLGIGILSHILTLVQLVPLMTNYSHHPFQQIYPHRDGSIVKAFQKTTSVIILIQVVIYTIFALLSQALTVKLLMVVVTWFVVGILFIALYIPWWYIKNTK